MFGGNKYHVEILGRNHPLPFGIISSNTTMTPESTFTAGFTAKRLNLGKNGAHMERTWISLKLERTRDVKNRKRPAASYDKDSIRKKYCRRFVGPVLGGKPEHARSG